MTNKIRYCILLAISCFAGCHAKAPPIEQLRVDSKDPLFVQSILDDQSSWFSLLEQLSHGLKIGNEDWLSIAKNFYEQTDAGATASLFISISRALPYNSQIVLKAVDYGFPIEKLCTVPFIEPSETEKLVFIDSSLANLASLKAEGITNARKCYESLERLK